MSNAGRDNFEFLVIGAGIVGLAVAYKLLQRKPGSSTAILEKEELIASHASGRNSGVLHAGFYYTANSLKARFSIAGNRELKNYCRSKGLKLEECGKLVVAKDKDELQKLFELEARGKANSSGVELISRAEAEKIEPNVQTFEKALWSPNTAGVDPSEICKALKEDLVGLGAQFFLDESFVDQEQNQILTSKGRKLKAHKVINCAGLYADKIAKQFKFGANYTILPFKGLYLKYTKDPNIIRTNIYPVPNLKNPFLGVHFTKLVDGSVKIGPTAIPAFWRENYSGFSRFKLDEVVSIVGSELKLFASNAFNFRSLAIEEVRKYSRRRFIDLSRGLVKEIDPAGFGDFTRPGIRAQLLNTRTQELVQDFVIEGDKRSVHVLNAVSPGFTCSFSFADYIIDSFVL